jgi:peptidoglycan/xylan/chitin deacetylase (PgdA/CDA1 family)
MPGSFSKYYHVRSRLRGLPRDFAWHLGLNRNFVKKARGGRILLYHGICKSQPLQFNTLFLKLRSFEEQLRFYKKYFNIISLDDYYDQRFSKERFNICLTFDDGFANNYQYVLPLLEQYEVPAAFFITGIREAGYDILWNDVLSIANKYGPEKIIFGKEEYFKGRDGKYISTSTGKKFVDVLRCTGFEDKIEMMKSLGSLRERVEKDHWLQMTEEEIRILSASKWVTIGSHGYYHNDLSKIEPARAKEEIKRSKLFLEKTIDKEVKAFAFPYGSYIKEILQDTRQTGFSQLLATEFLFPDDGGDATLRERLTINPFISVINQMHANITGNYK